MGTRTSKGIVAGLERSEVPAVDPAAAPVTSGDPDGVEAGVLDTCASTEEEVDVRGVDPPEADPESTSICTIPLAGGAWSASPLPLLPSKSRTSRVSRAQHHTSLRLVQCAKPSFHSISSCTACHRFRLRAC